MKLLLTSSGITNQSIARALKKLVNDKIKIAFIPTAANTVDEEKSWLIDDLNNCKKIGTVGVVDISALPTSVWLPRLKRANVILVGGGDAVHLLKCVNASGFRKEIRNLLKQKVYVGISAGSHIVSRTLHASSHFIFSRNKAPKGLGLANFYVRAHLNSPKFPKIRSSNIAKIVGKFDGDLYAIYDNSAVLVNGNKIEVVSEGVWKKFSKT